MAARYVRIGQHPDYRDEIRGTLSEILASTANPGTYAAPEDVTGTYLEMGSDGLWTGASVGYLTKAQADAVLAEQGVRATLKVGVPAQVDGGPVTWRGAEFSADSAKKIRLIGSKQQNIICGAPTGTITDAGVSYLLGPTSSPTSLAEYNAAKVNNLVYEFVESDTVTLKNTNKLFTYGAAWHDGKYSLARNNSAPWPQPNGTVGWWNKGGVRFYAEGVGDVYVCYVLNAVNTCKVFVDGKRFTDSAADGTVTNGVSSTSNSTQWVKLSFANDTRRCITVDTAIVKSIIHSPTVTLSAVKHVGKAIIFGDSFSSRRNAVGETFLTRVSMAGAALELLGYDVIDTSSGGTGFNNNGGGSASGKGSYLDYIQQYKNFGVPLGFNPGEYSLIWLFGTGNDLGDYTTNSYLNVIREAAKFFTKANIVVTSVYEGFNTVALAESMNANLYAAVQQAKVEYPGRIVWVPVDSKHTDDGVGVWRGTGSLAAPAYDGNADAYLSNPAQGASDRHPNAAGVIHGARYYAKAIAETGEIDFE